MLHTYLAALMLAAIALAASGCDGSSKSPATTPVATTPQTATTSSTQVSTTETAKPLTRAQLLAQANAICGRAKAQLSSTVVKSQQEYARALPQAAAYERAAVSELTKLVPPASVASDFQQVLAALQQFSANTANLSDYAQTSEIIAGNALYRNAIQAQEQLHVIAGRTIFKACALV
jgi:hypothetical protein